MRQIYDPITQTMKEVPLLEEIKPVMVKDGNEESGQKVGILFSSDVKDYGIGNGKVVNLDKYILGKRDFETEKENKSRTTFLRRAREERVLLTSGIEGKNADATVWELKTAVKKGMIQWTTRGQCSIHNEEDPKEIPVVAMTGYSRRGKTHKEVSDMVQEVMSSDKKEINYRQMSLRGANEQYKSGGHCTPKYSSRSYKMIYDGRRRVVVPEELKIKYLNKGLPLPKDQIYETEAWKEAKEAILSRCIMNTWKKAKFVKHSPRLLPSTKEYEDFNEHSVVVDINSGRSVDITSKDPRDLYYNQERRLLSEGILEKLAKFRAYRRRLKNLESNIKESKLKIENLATQTRWLDCSGESPLVVDYKMKKLPVKSKYLDIAGELKRLKKLQGLLKIKDEKCELGLVGGEASNDLRKFLSIGYTESMKLVEIRYLPFLIKINY